MEVADKANPPVVRIMDYGKYKYEAAQRAKESRKKASNVVVKEMKYRPKIGAGDFDTKTRKVEKFLLEGHKVKITIMFRGREVSHPEIGRRILDDIAERVEEFAKVEVYPRGLEGRNMTMVLGPDAKKGKSRKRSDSNNADRDGGQGAAADQPATDATNPDTDQGGGASSTEGQPAAAPEAATVEASGVETA